MRSGPVIRNLPGKTRVREEKKDGEKDANAADFRGGDLMRSLNLQQGGEQIHRIYLIVTHTPCKNIMPWTHQDTSPVTARLNGWSR